MDAAIAKLTPETLVKGYRLWQRYPSVQLEPAKPDPERHLAELEQALGILDGCIGEVEAKGL
jgi:hypothetical protein